MKVMTLDDLKRAEEKLDALRNKLVPLVGKADTVAGEIVRAMSRIAYQFWNDGDHIGVGYGRGTCNPAARYLRAVCHEVGGIVDGLWGLESEDLYELGLELLLVRVMEYLEGHPELWTVKNEEDMWDYQSDTEDW